ncbi:MAG: hypothetical protein LBN74_07695 [Prevotella sp.]|jgi:hypothetical protein|nr:hypothetical protein [Prevotella sp.]
MKTLTLIAISLFLSSFAGSATKSDNLKESAVINSGVAAYEHSELLAPGEQTVLICTGQYSKRYHNSMCRGMKACKGDSQKVSLSEAKRKGLTACGYCYK